MYPYSCVHVCLVCTCSVSWITADMDDKINLAQAKILMNAIVQRSVNFTAHMCTNYMTQQSAHFWKYSQHRKIEYEIHIKCTCVHKMLVCCCEYHSLHKEHTYTLSMDCTHAFWLHEHVFSTHFACFIGMHSDLASCLAYTYTLYTSNV